MSCRVSSILPFTLLALASLTPVQAQLLGRISFPNSGAEAAQEDFIDGVLYLHNFEYEDARDAFERAQAIDPEFALAYWGEAMTLNHPIWMKQDTEAGRAALGRLGVTSASRRAKAGTAREAAYLEAVEVLYGLTPESSELTKKERDLGYRDALRRLAATYPEDDEAKVFHALSILGSAHEGRDFATYMKAAAVASEVWDANDQHPGAAHYLIHSFDDPVHAPLGLPMAQAYARIAPSAAHAQHMTSHIFVAMGMWDDVIDANVVARDVQNAAFAERGRPPRLCGHYPYWLEYGYLQQGRVEEATAVLESCRDSLEATSDEGVKWHFAAMSARHLIDLEAWDASDVWPDRLERTADGHHNYVFARGLAAHHRGDAAGVEAARATLERITAGDSARASDSAQVAALLALELEGLTLLAADPDGAVELLRTAAELEAQRPYTFGPPAIVKPTWELLGEVLLGLGRGEEAVAEFREQLERTPERTLSLLGLARSAKATRQWELARESYRRLAEIWRHADDSIAAAAEARNGAQAR